VVRIVERRGGICCCKNTLFLSESPNIFLENCILCMGFNAKSSNCHKNLIVIHWIFRKLSYLCPRIKAFFVYCKIQKKSGLVSPRWRYLHQMNWWKESTGNKKKSELSIEYGRTFQILFEEYYYSSYRYRLTLSMATLCKASQDFLPNPL